MKKTYNYIIIFLFIIISFSLINVNLKEQFVFANYEVLAYDVECDYDGNLHNIDVQVNSINDVTIYYSLNELTINNYLDDGFTDFGIIDTCNVKVYYFVVDKQGQEVAKGSQKLIINKLFHNFDDSILNNLTKIFDNKPIVVPEFNLESGIEYTIKYKKINQISQVYTSIPPTNVGNYEIKLTLKENEIYRETIFTRLFFITPAKISIKIDDKESMVGCDLKELTYSVTKGNIFNDKDEILSLEKALGTTVGKYSITVDLESVNPNYELEEIENGIYLINYLSQTVELEDVKVTITSSDGVKAGIELKVEHIETLNFDNLKNKNEICAYRVYLFENGNVINFDKKYTIKFKFINGDVMQKIDEMCFIKNGETVKHNFQIMNDDLIFEIDANKNIVFFQYDNLLSLNEIIKLVILASILILEITAYILYRKAKKKKLVQS